MLLSGAEIDIWQEEQGANISLVVRKKNVGGAIKRCIIINHGKTTLPINYILGANLCEKNLKSIFQGQIYFLGFFFSLGNFVYGKS